MAVPVKSSALQSGRLQIGWFCPVDDCPFVVYTSKNEVDHHLLGVFLDAAFIKVFFVAWATFKALIFLARKGVKKEELNCA